MASCDDIAPLGTDGGLFSDYTNIIASALVIYEHSITFSQEMRVIWQRRRTLVSAIFLINRYNILCSAVIVLLLGTHAIENATIQYIAKCP
ncbi:hypothetical protein PsYK624_099470 [Phanerochaete sordida]|uniref:DUF6533 domain-containing protein n=1 Tax=Phanerochaete sordida TaxID=48140 RepID=A0A9P3GFA4_9APHY|nr:hypothetical protein PsYK624_099470 [Phanerochaete sordida]